MSEASHTDNPLEIFKQRVRSVVLSNFGIMSFSPLIGNILGEYVGRMAVDLGLEIVESILVIREVFFEIIPEELRDHPMLKYMDQENYIDFVNVIIHHFEELHRKNLLQRYFAIVTKSLMDYAKKHNIKEDVARETIAGLYLSGAYL